eukprot:CAMPEP_0184486768 /NCGR_PEP_ID=MMETSP0113_2-20130426/8579_1 /TAXON_ID=91329 /ORGANISM="Norrisiella sphaerica, Strain BC52" /LENGTH=144 /DNA_ID=CAMNT_0026868805 /DNA_START=165 /DNA_END=599 /DNA_ORIENTATION=+
MNNVIPILSSSQALLAFVALTVLHILIIIGHRSYLIIRGERKANTFEKSGSGAENTFVSRVGTAHANCVENLVLFASVVLVNKVFMASSINDLASYYLYARVCQSFTHWIAVNEAAVTVRFSFFAIQLGLLLAMMYITAKTLIY